MKYYQLSVFSNQFSGSRPSPTAYSLYLLSFITFIILLAAPAFAQDYQPPAIVGVRVGIVNRCKLGLWTPVEVTLQGGSESLAGTVTVTVPDGDDVPSRVLTPPNKPVQILPGRRITVPLYVRIGRSYGDLQAEFIVNGRTVSQKTMEPSIEAGADYFREPLEEQPLFAVLGSSSIGIEDIPRIKEINEQRRPVTARVDDVGQLPTCWYGYEGVDVLLVSTSQAEMYRKLTPDSARLEAIDQWVRMGGRMVLCVGSQADEVLAKDSAFSRFAPGRLEKVVTLSQTGAFEIYCGSTTAVPQTQGGEKLSLRAPKLTDVRGIIEASEIDLPLIIRTPRGLGEIIFVAADLDQGPISKWTDRSLLLSKLLDLPTGRIDELSGDAALMRPGYSDLAGQLRSALNQFTGVKMIPFSLVALMIIFYILLIGPGDYFFLRKIVGRMQWTWLTFPIIVVAVSGAAYGLSYYLKGDQLRVNQIDLVDVDSASGLVRGTTWLNILSPRMESFNLSLGPQTPDGKTAANAQSLFAWMGLPGSALGGMNPRGGGPSLWPEHYNFTPDLNAMLGVPIQVWSTKSFTGRWSAYSDAFPRAELSDEDRTLSGSIINTLDFPLKNCVVVYDRWAHELGTLAPGQTALLDQYSKRSELKTLLTGKRAIFEEKYRQSQEITPYDAESKDPTYILWRMMFYNAIDGLTYTRMDNGYQTFVDLSYLLKTGRAILIAEGPGAPQDKHHGAALLRDGKFLTGPMDKHVTLYRFVFPVKKITSTSESP